MNFIKKETRTLEKIDNAQNDPVELVDHKCSPVPPIVQFFVIF